MTSLTRKTFLKIAGSLALMASVGMSQAAADQLDDIMKAGKIRIGVNVANPPYGMLDSQLKPVGSDVETAQKLAEDWGLEIEIVETVNATRVPNLQTNRADLIISAMSITPDRQKVVDFSIPYSVIRGVVVAAKDVDISGLEDLRGKTIAVARAGVPDRIWTDKSKEYDLTIQRYEDDATLVAAAVSGQAMVVITSGNLGNEIVRRNDNFEEKFEESSYELAVGIRKGEAALQEKVNAWLKANLDGDLNEIYKKYHMIDLPENIRAQK